MSLTSSQVINFFLITYYWVKSSGFACQVLSMMGVIEIGASAFGSYVAPFKTWIGNENWLSHTIESSQVALYARYCVLCLNSHHQVSCWFSECILALLTRALDIVITEHRRCSSLASITMTIPDTLQYIGSSAFSYTNLTSIVIPNSVTVVDSSAFWGCMYPTFLPCYTVFFVNTRLSRQCRCSGMYVSHVSSFLKSFQI